MLEQQITAQINKDGRILIPSLFRKALQGVRKEVALQMLSLLGVEVVPFEEADAWTIGFLYPDTKHLGISVGYKTCIGLGLRLKRIILTADSIWRDIALPIEIRLIR